MRPLRNVWELRWGKFCNGWGRAQTQQNRRGSVGRGWKVCRIGRNACNTTSRGGGGARKFLWKPAVERRGDGGEAPGRMPEQGKHDKVSILTYKKYLREQTRVDQYMRVCKLYFLIRFVWASWPEALHVSWATVCPSMRACAASSVRICVCVYTSRFQPSRP